MILKTFFVSTMFVLMLGIVSCQKQPAPVDQKQQVSLWSCSMHPQVRQDSPGQCPICGMNLTQVQENHTQEHASFFLTSYRQQLIGVATTKVVKKEVLKKIYAPGRLAFDPELYTALNEYREAIRQAQELSNSPLPDVKRSASQLIRSAKLRLQMLGITPEQEASLQKGDSLILPTSRRHLLVYADVFEIDLPYVHKGLNVELFGRSLQGKELKGEVLSIDPVINSTTRTARVRIAINELPVMLRPESYFDVVILSPQGKYLVVPFSAVLTTGLRSLVFVQEKAGRFSPREVQVAFDTGEEAPLVRGVHEGEEIVISANFLIDSESRIQALRSGEEKNAHEHH